MAYSLVTRIASPFNEGVNLKNKSVHSQKILRKVKLGLRQGGNLSREMQGYRLFWWRFTEKVKASIFGKFAHFSS